MLLIMNIKRLIEKIWFFARANIKLFLVPIVIVTVVVAGILILIQDTEISPMIYTIF